MRKFIGVLCQLALALPALGMHAFGSMPALSGPAAPLVITDVDVIDGAHGLRKRQTIVVRGDTIVQVGSSQDVSVPTSARVIDGRGKYVIAGLWDAHVHLALIPALSIDTWYPLLIANGVTSVMDMGAPLDKILTMRASARAKRAVAPRIFVAGPLIDGPHPLYPAFSVAAGSIAEERADIDSLKAAGVNFVRLYELLPPAIFQDAVRYAHERGLSVGGHVPALMDALDVAGSGIDGLEHLRGFARACSTSWSKLLSERRAAFAPWERPSKPDSRAGGLLDRYDAISLAQRTLALHTQDEARCDRLVAALAAGGVVQTPALTKVTAPATRFYASSEWRSTFRYLPAPVRNKWLSGVAKSSRDGVPPEIRLYADWAMAMVARLNRHGVKLMAGTDGPSEYLTPGFGLHRELASLVAAGLTPMQALTAATLQPARFSRMQDKLGTIEAGKWADMVLLDANPLVDIRNTEKIAAVIKGGRLYDRAALDAMLVALTTR